MTLCVLYPKDKPTIENLPFKQALKLACTLLQHGVPGVVIARDKAAIHVVTRGADGAIWHNRQCCQKAEEAANGLRLLRNGRYNNPFLPWEGHA